MDSDVPSEFKGKLIKKNFEVNDIVKVGEVIAEIETDGEDSNESAIILKESKNVKVFDEVVENIVNEPDLTDIPSVDLLNTNEPEVISNIDLKSDKFYSPLVRNIAKKENISQQELDSISGSGKDGRVTKQDILNYLSSGSTSVSVNNLIDSESSNSDQIIEIDRMGKIIFDHMTNSKKISAHVQSFVEVDVTNLWDWREKYKNSFLAKEGQKLTFTPLFINAVIKSLKDYPILNSSVVDEKIVVKRSINIGMATAVENGNLIVPVIKNADHLNLKGLTLAVNDLSNRARSKSLNLKKYLKEPTLLLMLVILVLLWVLQ